MLEIVRIDYKDKNVAVRKVYTKASDAFAYSDKECKKKVSTNELYDAFVKGLVIVDTAGDEYLPISCKIAGGVATVTYVTTDTATPTTAKLATVKS